MALREREPPQITNGAAFLPDCKSGFPAEVFIKKRLLAEKLDLLEFIKERELVYAYEIEENFGYSHRSVPNTLTRLKKAGLIINMTKGCWELTVEGYRKLEYYKRG